jgi:restriction system protein
VKLKMAPNSGFAILLRSPWWISFAIAAAIVLACGALLPAHIAPFAAVGAVPIAVVGCIAAWRQWRAPGAARVQAALQAAGAMPWREFADSLERAWRAEGQQVQRTDGRSSDLRITKDGKTVLVAARRWKAASHGVEPLRELQAAVQREGARAGVYVALSGTVSENARGFARDNGLVLLEGDALAALLLKAGAKDA